MTHQRSEDEGFSADRALIEALAKGLGLTRWPGDLDTLVELGDMENTRILAHRHGTFTFETTSRGQRSIEAAFSSARDARRYMIMDLCESYRFHTRLPPMVMKRLAAGSQLEDGPTGHQLTWSGGEATFVNRHQAVTFSWAINADPDAIVASYQHVNGEPLFDLGIPVDEWNIHAARGRPVGRVAQPRVETPPPDDEGAADRAAIDAMLADRRWERRAPSGGDLLWVGDRYQGRAIAYRQSQFVYESTTGAGRYRDTKATFSTAAAARRFLLIDLGDVVRRWAGMPRIQPNRLAPDCTLEEGPTGFELTWLDGRATFAAGAKGHMSALNFSWVAKAELGEIVASYRHPNGEPIFDLRHDAPPPAR